MMYASQSVRMKRQNVRPWCIANSLSNGCQTVSLPIYKLLRYSQGELTAIWGLGSGRKRNGQREGKVTERLSLVRMQPLVCKKKRFLCNHISHVPVTLSVTLTLSTSWMHAELEIIVCKFGRNRAICLVVEAICAKTLHTAGRTTDTARLH